MPVNRMRMRPWLEAKLQSNTISGLQWVDKEKRMFSIAWKHAARHGWEMDKDACLFKQWAVHTGKFRQGQTDPDPKTWKANFRCAMNSLHDIEEVKDRSVNRGCGAVRVYRMLPSTSKPKEKRPKRDSKKKSKSSKVKEEVSDSGDSSSGEQQSATRLYADRSAQESTVDSTDMMSSLCEATYMETEVPDFETSVDIESADPDSTSRHYSFEVSPDHSPAYDSDTDAIIEITQQLEQDHTQWLQGGGFLTNEIHRPESYSSPSSEWSDCSGEDADLPLYTNLSARMPSTDELNFTDLWSSSNTSFFQHISCPY